MADKDGITIDPKLFEFGKKLEIADKKAPGYIIDGLDAQGKEVRKKLKKASPVSKTTKKNKERLKNRWKAYPTIKTSGVYEKPIGSTAPHYHLVERGHRVVPRGGKNTINRSLQSGKGYVAGTRFFEKTMEAMTPEIYKEFENIVDSIMEEVFNDF